MTNIIKEGPYYTGLGATGTDPLPVATSNEDAAVFSVVPAEPVGGWGEQANTPSGEWGSDAEDEEEPVVVAPVVVAPVDPENCAKIVRPDGRCGPTKDGAACATAFEPYCSEASGWCGNTDAHKNAQESSAYDF